MARETVRIGCAAAFWGDSNAGAEQLVRLGNIDFLVFDYLAEITMSLLARARARKPELGYVPDFVEAVAPLLPEIKQKGIRVVSNAGGINPHAAANALRSRAMAAGIALDIAVVTGDDLIGSRRRNPGGWGHRNVLRCGPAGEADDHERLSRARSRSRSRSTVGRMWSLPGAVSIWPWCWAPGARLRLVVEATMTCWRKAVLPVICSNARRRSPAAYSLTGATFPDGTTWECPSRSAAAAGTFVISKPEGPADWSARSRSASRCFMRSATRQPMSFPTSSAIFAA